MSKKNQSKKPAETQKTEEKKTEEKKTEEKERPAYETYVPKPAPKMTFYTVMAMIAALVAVAAAYLGMSMMTKPVFYVLEAFAGVTIGELGTRWMPDIIAQESKSAITFQYMMIAAGILLVICGILAIITGVRAIIPEKKPIVLLSIIAFACALAAGLLLAIGVPMVMPAIRAEVKSFANYDIKGFEYYNVYLFYVIAVIANLVCSAANVFGVTGGNSRYTRDGKAF